MATGQEGPARRHVPRDPDRRDRLPDGGQADLLTGSLPWGRRSPTGDPVRMPHVATSPTDLLATLVRRAPTSTASGWSSTTRPRSATPGIRDLAWTAAFSTDDATTAAAQWLVWEASQELGARSASIQALYEARARGEVRGFTVPALNLRTQIFDMARTVYEAAAAADVGGGHPRARAQRADLHVPASDRLRDLGPGRRHRRRLARARSSSRATTTSSTPRSTPPIPRR